MVHVREIDAALRSIRTNVISAIDVETGKVNYGVISAQSAALKKWVDDFENMYVEEAKRKPIEANKIASEGRALLEEAWHAYEVLLDVELQAGEPPRPTKYETLPSGVVSGESRTEVLSLLRDLTNKFSKFRREAIKG